MSLFLAVPLLVLVAVSVGSVLLGERLARSSALDQAQRTAVGLTRFVIAPVIGDVAVGVPGTREELDRRVQDRLADGSIEALLVWRPPREVIYSSDPETVGPVAPTPQLRAAAAGRLTADIEEARGPGRPHGTGPLVEVYTPLSVGRGPMAVAVFFRYEGIQQDGMLLRNRIIPVTVGGLVVLQLIQMPLGLSLFRRVRRQDAERADLLARSLTAADQERRAIAADVHDGPVQDLAGVAYLLGSLRSIAGAEAQATVDGVVAAVREAVAWLRRLMVDVYPPDLSPSAMAMALADLAESVPSSGSTLEVDVEPVPGLSSAGAAVLYRTAKDALSDEWCPATTHYSWLNYRPATLRGRPAVRMEVGHDCPDALSGATVRGLDPADAVRLMRARISDLGGSLEVDRAGR